MLAIASIAKRLPRLSSVHVENVRVLVRSDLTGPSLTGSIPSEQRDALQASRIVTALPTLKNLLNRGARIIVATHIGDPQQPKSSLSVAEQLASFLNHEIRFPDELFGDGVSKLVNDTRSGQIVMLENLYFDAREQSNNPEVARYLATLCDVYINDSLSLCEFPLASTVGLAKSIGARAMGLRLEHELDGLLQFCETPKRPLSVIAGGPLTAGLLAALQKQVERMGAGDTVILSANLADTVLFIWGQHDDSARIQQDCVQSCKLLISKIQARDVGLIVCSSNSQNRHSTTNAKAQQNKTSDQPDDDYTGSQESQTAVDWEHALMRIRQANMVLWLDDSLPNSLHLSSDSKEQLVRRITEGSIETAIWGSFASHAIGTLAPQFTPCWHSTGDTATLKALADQPLPGLEALQQQEQLDHDE